MAGYMSDLIGEIKKKKQQTNQQKEEIITVSEKKTKATLESKIPSPAKKGVSLTDLEKIKQELKKSMETTTQTEEIRQIIPQKHKIIQKETEENPAAQIELQKGTTQDLPVNEQDVEYASEEQKKIESAQKELIDSYGDVKVFKVYGSPLLHYSIPVQRPTSTEKTIINTIKEAATRLITISPYKIRDPEQKRNVYFQKVMEIMQNSPQLNIQKRRWGFYAEAVVREMVGYGIIDPLVNDDKLEEIMVIGPQMPVYIFHRDHEMMTTNIEFFSDQEIVDLINRIARQVGRRVDISTPLLDARLPDGSRVNATIPPASVLGSTLTIRKFKKDPLTIIDILRKNTIDLDVAAFLWVCVDGLGVKPANILISGGTGSGKTTMLNCLGAFIPPEERIISIEDTAELNLPLKHWIRFEGRPPGLEGTGELTIDIMTKNSLRMRPDRVMVGEIRHAEAFSLFTAMNTGHDGAIRKNTLIQLSGGKKVEIGKFVEEYFIKKPPTKDGKFEFAEINETIFVPSLNKQSLKIEEKEITNVWRKQGKHTIVNLKLKSGNTIKLTHDHPVYKIQNGIKEITAKAVQAGDSICTLKIPNTQTNQKINEFVNKNVFQIIGKTTITTQISKDLKILIESDLQFEKIIETNIETLDEPVYDLTVKDNHNYIANGIIVSNCMGTVHANSAKETVIRVTSPPMNVPEVMLSGLDLIIVEQRLHDKKKGTIRRVTDISEVSGVLEGKTKTKLVYEYDHVEDKFKRTKNEISFLKILQKFTGWSDERLNQELEKRKRFLKKLDEKDIHKMNDVYSACQEFIYKETEEAKNARIR